MTQTFAQNLAFESLDTVQVVTGGFEAKYNTLGGIINTITREGSDEFRATGSFYLTNEALNQRTNYGALLYEREWPFSDDPVPPSSTYQAAINIGGPIIKHQLWYSASFQFEYRNNAKLVGPPLNLPHVPQTVFIYLPRLKAELGACVAASPDAVVLHRPGVL